MTLVLPLPETPVKQVQKQRPLGASPARVLDSAAAFAPLTSWRADPVCLSVNNRSDLCSKAACPLPAGPLSITLVQLLPPIAPPVRSLALLCFHPLGTPSRAPSPAWCLARLRTHLRVTGVVVSSSLRVHTGRAQASSAKKSRRLSALTRPASLTFILYLQGDYGLNVVVRGLDGGELTCVQVTFSLVLPSSGAARGVQQLQASRKLAVK